MSNVIPQNQPVLIKSEIDIQISTAKAYPRDVAKAIQNAIKLVTMDEETAESCIYSLPRKNENGEYIKGESIRLAEILASCWTNIHAATRIVSNDGRKITAEAAVWDLEANVKVCKQVQRNILKKDGKTTFSEEMQVVTGNAASSIALRNGILSIIPRAYAKKVYDAAVNYAIGDQKKIIERVSNLFSRFEKLGVYKDRIFDYFGKKTLEEFDRSDIEVMIGIGTAIKEKNITLEEAFKLDSAPKIETVTNIDELVNQNLDNNHAKIDLETGEIKK